MSIINLKVKTNSNSCNASIVVSPYGTYGCCGGSGHSQGPTWCVELSGLSEPLYKKLKERKEDATIKDHNPYIVAGWNEPCGDETIPVASLAPTFNFLAENGYRIATSMTVDSTAIWTFENPSVQDGSPGNGPGGPGPEQSAFWKSYNFKVPGRDETTSTIGRDDERSLKSHATAASTFGGDDERSLKSHATAASTKASQGNKSSKYSERSDAMQEKSRMTNASGRTKKSVAESNATTLKKKSNASGSRNGRDNSGSDTDIEDEGQEDDESSIAQDQRGTNEL